MKRLILLITLFLITILFPESGNADEKSEAISMTQKAIMQYPTVKLYKKRVENKIMRYVPVDRKTIGVIGGLVISTSQGYVDTKVLKNLRVTFYSAEIRPDIRYNFRDGSVESTVGLKWDF